MALELDLDNTKGEIRHCLSLINTMKKDMKTQEGTGGLYFRYLVDVIQ